jgi:hypothetical protein
VKILFEKLGTHVYTNKNVYTCHRVSDIDDAIIYRRQGSSLPIIPIDMNKIVLQYIKERFPSVHLGNQRDEPFYWLFMDHEDEDAFQLYLNHFVDIEI